MRPERVMQLWIFAAIVIGTLLLLASTDRLTTGRSCETMKGWNRTGRIEARAILTFLCALALLQICYVGYLVERSGILTNLLIALPWALWGIAGAIILCQILRERRKDSEFLKRMRIRR